MFFFLYVIDIQCILYVYVARLLNFSGEVLCHNSGGFLDRRTGKNGWFCCQFHLHIAKMCDFLVVGYLPACSHVHVSYVSCRYIVVYKQAGR